MGLNNSEYAFNDNSIHYAGSEHFNSNIPIMTFEIPGFSVSSIPMIINDNNHAIEVEQSISSIVELMKNNVQINRTAFGIEISCESLGGMIRIHDNVGKLIFDQEVHQHILFIPNELFENGVFHFMYSKGNSVQKEKLFIVR